MYTFKTDPEKIGLGRRKWSQKPLMDDVGKKNGELVYQMSIIKLI